MLIIGLITNVANDTEMAALTGFSNQEYVYHSGFEAAFMFRNNVATGDVQADDLSGWWIKDTVKCLDLAEYKTFRNDEINERTGELIALGYSYSGFQFPLSDHAQTNLLGIYTVKEFLTYPIEWNNINDTAVYQITDATDVSNIFLTALSTKKSSLDSGTHLKQQIEACTTYLEVQAITDNR
jgi:hypothetical protein